MKAPLPPDESARMRALRDYAVLDTPPEPDFDDIATLAAQICDMPIALITLIDGERQWFKAKVGMDLSETPREVAFCAHAINRPRELLVVNDATKDERFADNPYVTEENGIRFYAGAPLVTPGGHALGTLCVVDRKPRELSAGQREALAVLSRHVMTQLQLRRQNREQHTLLRRFNEAQAVAKVGSWETDLTTREIVWSEETHRIFGTDPARFRPSYDAFLKFVHPEDRESVNVMLARSVAEGLEPVMDHRIVLPDGTTKILEERWRIFCDAQGRPTHAVGTCQDITARKQSEAAMAQTLERLTEAQRIGRIGDWAWDCATDMVQWSAEMYAILGRDPAAGPPRGYDDVAAAAGMDAASLEEQSVMVRRAIETGEPQEYELVTVRPDGNRQTLQVRAVPAKDSQGRVIGLRGTLQDVTERAALEAERRRLIRDLGERVKELRVQQQVADLLRDDRLAAPELLQRVAGLLPAAMLHAGEASARIICGGKTHESAGFAASPWMLAAGFGGPAGSLGRIEICYRRELPAADEGPFLREERQMVDTIAQMLRTHFERLQTSESLRLSEERYALAAHASQAALWDWDMTTDTIYFTDRYREILGGYTKEEFPDTLAGFYSKVHADDKAVVKQAIADHVATRRPQPSAVEFRILAKSGDYKWVHTSAQAVWDAQGRPVRMVGSTVDITEQKKAMEQMRVSEERFRMLSKATQDAIWDWDLVTGNFWWSEGLEVLFGYHPAELPPVVEAWSERVHPDDRETTEQGVYRAIEQGEERWAGEYRFLRKDGAYAHVLDRGYIIRDAAGKAVRMIGGMSDVTERQQAIAALHDSEEKYRLLFANNPQPMWVFDAETLRFLAVNQAAVQHYGYSEAEFLAMTVLDIRAEGDRTTREQALARMVRTGRDTALRRHVKKDGTVIEVEATSDSVVLDDRPARLVVARDVTERRRAEAKVREQAALLDKAQDAIMVRDLSHRLTYWNRSAERLYGWTAAEALGQPMDKLLHVDHEKFADADRQVRATGEWSGEIQKHAKDGTMRTIDGRWTLLRDDEGQPQAILTIDTDITERKKLEQQFMRAQRMESIGTLAGGIAHDLNNLLAPITMGVELLKQFNPDEKSRRLITNIERSAKRGADLVKQVLSFARGVDGARVSIHLKHLVREAESILENTFPKNIRLEAAAPNDLWLVQGDPTQLNQVLLNLCVNARDAMPQGGHLTIQVRNTRIDGQYAAMNPNVRAGPYVQIEVTDTGTGMPPEIIDRIFDPFFTTKEMGKGTGLGLATVQGIVRSHGGFITVYSEVGKGSTFKVYLPAQSETTAPEETAPVEEALPRGAGELILVVDDEAAILGVTRQTLEAFGYEVLTAEDGAQAIGLYALHRTRVALVLTDMMMPVMDGPALITALQRINPAVRVIATSGLNANGGVARAAAAGVRHFLPKPYTAEILLKLIRQVLGPVEKPPAA